LAAGHTLQAPGTGSRFVAACLHAASSSGAIEPAGHESGTREARGGGRPSGAAPGRLSQKVDRQAVVASRAGAVCRYPLPTTSACIACELARTELLLLPCPGHLEILDPLFSFSSSISLFRCWVQSSDLRVETTAHMSTRASASATARPTHLSHFPDEPCGVRSVEGWRRSTQWQWQWQQE